MWLFTQYGFYSIVQVQDGSANWQVRARDSGDLARLLKASDIAKPLIHTPNADYAYRVIVSQEERDTIFAALAKSIDYPNFKDRIAQVKTQSGRLGLYHELWSLVRGSLQKRRSINPGEHSEEVTERL